MTHRRRSQPGKAASYLWLDFFVMVLLSSSTSARDSIGPSSAAGQDQCYWLPWHPAEVSVQSASQRVQLKTIRHLCETPHYITDFYAELEPNSTGLSFLSAKCSDGNYLGYYAVFSGSPLAENLASNTFGFSTVNGSARESLESIGIVTDPEAQWRDQCPLSTVVTGYEINLVPGQPIDQIRLVCSDPKSMCGAAEAPGLQDSAPVLSPTLESRLTPSPAGAPSTYVVFAVQWISPEVVTKSKVSAALQQLDGLHAARLQSLGQDCIPSAAEKDKEQACFQAGPMTTNDAFRIVQYFGDSNSTQTFAEALEKLGSNVSDAKFLFASISDRPAVDKAHPVATAPVPGEKSSDSNSQGRAFRSGLVIGCVVAGVLAACLLVLLGVLLIQRRRRRHERSLPTTHTPVKPAASSGSSPALPEPADNPQPPVNIALPIIKSPFAAFTGSAARLAWTLTKEEAESSGEEVAAARKSRSKNLQSMLQSSPLPTMTHTHVGWSLQSTSLSLEPPNTFDRAGQGLHRARMTQDSDELLEAGKGNSAWLTMHDDVLEVLEEGCLDPGGALSAGQQAGSSSRSLVGVSPSKRQVVSSWGASDWEISPADLQICRGPDGRLLELGSGAFGKVYKALLNEVTEVAVKRLEALSGNQRTLFLREVEIHKRCRSAHVVQFLGACIQEDCMFLVTELMDTSLDRIIHDEGPFTWETRGKRIALDVAQALAYLHKQRVVHLDIKSRNILLTREGRAKIADVGLSQVLENTYLSLVDSLGTFAYAAPELLSGGSNCSTKADIWSYGILLHEMITREQPKRGALSDRRPEDCPKHIDELILRCLTRHPADRPSAKAIVKVLQAESPEQAEAILTASLLEDPASRSLESRFRPAERTLPKLAVRSSSTPDLITTKLTRWSCS